MLLSFRQVTGSAPSAGPRGRSAACAPPASRPVTARAIASMTTSPPAQCRWLDTVDGNGREEQ